MHLRMKTKALHRIKIGFRILGDEAPLYSIAEYASPPYFCHYLRYMNSYAESTTDFSPPCRAIAIATSFRTSRACALATSFLSQHAILYVVR